MRTGEGKRSYIDCDVKVQKICHQMVKSLPAPGLKMFCLYLDCHCIDNHWNLYCGSQGDSLTVLTSFDSNRTRK